MKARAKVEPFAPLTGRTSGEPFDAMTVSLEPGVSLVEASAGTGKTFSITQLVLRLLLDRKSDGTWRVGGIGNIPGAVLGGLVIGLLRALSDQYVGAQWQQAMLFGMLIAILVFRPQGLFGSTAREKV